MMFKLSTCLGHAASSTHCLAIRKCASPRGFTLVELVIVIGIMSVAFSAITITIYTMSKVNSHLQTEIPASTTRARLSSQLREDAHQSTKVELQRSGQGPAMARFSMPDDSQVTYEAMPQAILRRRLQADKLLHQELFRLPETTAIRWSVEEMPNTFVTLQLERNPGRISQATDSHIVDTIDAAVGLHTKAR